MGETKNYKCELIKFDKKNKNNDVYYAIKCPKCNGSGIQRKFLWLGWYEEVSCEYCEGEGYIKKEEKDENN